MSARLCNSCYQKQALLWIWWLLFCEDRRFWFYEQLLFQRFRLAISALQFQVFISAVSVSFQQYNFWPFFFSLAVSVRQFHLVCNFFCSLILIISFLQFQCVLLKQLVRVWPFQLCSFSLVFKFCSSSLTVLVCQIYFVTFSKAVSSCM